MLSPWNNESGCSELVLAVIMLVIGFLAGAELRNALTNDARNADGDGSPKSND